MLSANFKKTLETVNPKCQEIALKLVKCKHIFFCGEGIADCIAKEGALKMKELTYLHCQAFKLSELGNNFSCYFKANPKTAVIFVILDHQKDTKYQMIGQIQMLVQTVDIMPIIVTDIKDTKVRDKLKKLTEGRIIFTQRSGFALSGLICIIPL